MTTPLWTIDYQTAHRRLSPPPARALPASVNVTRRVAAPRAAAPAGPNSARVCALVAGALLLVSLGVAAVAGGTAAALLDLSQQGVTEMLDRLAAWQLDCAYGLTNLATSSPGSPGPVR